MQMTPVAMPVALTAYELNRRPFRKDGVPSLGSFAVHAYGEVYTKEGQIQRDPDRPLGYKPIHEFV